MTTLAANKIRTFADGNFEEYPVVADDIIYQGAAVGEDDAGRARPLQAGDVFLGFADVKADNAGGAAGEVTVLVKKRGNVHLPVTGAAAVTVNDRPAVYAADDDTFTLTSTSNSLIGYVSRFLSSGQCVVEFDATMARAALQA
jgi:hypothetical protein